MTYRQTELYDETCRVLRGDWTLEFRQPEMCAFEIVMHDCHSSLTWEVLEGRRTAAKRSRDEYIQHLRLVFATFYYFASRNRGLARSMYADLTARKLELSTREVWTCIKDAVLFGVPQLMGVNEVELRRVA